MRSILLFLLLTIAVRAFGDAGALLAGEASEAWGMSTNIEFQVGEANIGTWTEAPAWYDERLALAGTEQLLDEKRRILAGQLDDASGLCLAQLAWYPKFRPLPLSEQAQARRSEAEITLTVQGWPLWSPLWRLNFEVRNAPKEEFAMLMMLEPFDEEELAYDVAKAQLKACARWEHEFESRCAYRDSLVDSDRKRDVEALCTAMAQSQPQEPEEAASEGIAAWDDFAPLYEIAFQGPDDFARFERRLDARAKRISKRERKFFARAREASHFCKARVSDLAPVASSIDAKGLLWMPIAHTPRFDPLRALRVWEADLDYRQRKLVNMEAMLDDCEAYEGDPCDYYGIPIPRVGTEREAEEACRDLLNSLHADVLLALIARKRSRYDKWIDDMMNHVSVIGDFEVIEESAKRWFAPPKWELSLDSEEEALSSWTEGSIARFPGVTERLDAVQDVLIDYRFDGYHYGASDATGFDGLTSIPEVPGDLLGNWYRDPFLIQR